MKIIYFLSFIFFLNPSFAQNYNPLTVQAKYAVDINSTWKTKNLSSKIFKSFDKSNSLNIGYNINSSVWCKFKIKNHSPKKYIKTWLCFNNNHLDSIVLYDNVKQNILGDRTQKTSPFIQTQAFEIILKPNEEKTLLVRIKKEISFLEFSFGFYDKYYLTQQSNRRIASVSFFVGFIFSLILFNTVLLFISKNKLYFYYIIYSILSSFYIFISSNYAKYFLFPDFLYFSEFRIYVASFWFISLSVFLAFYLDLKKYQPRKYHAIYTINSINFIIVISSILLLVMSELRFLKLFMTVGYINFLIVIGLIFWSGISHLKTDKKTSIYVLIAFFPQLIWGLSIILKSFQLIPKNLHEDWLVIISMYEIFLFGFVLTKNYFDMFLKNNELNQEIMIEKEKFIQVITQVQIRERRNIANIIHDNLGSKIAYISHLLKLKNNALASETVKELANDVREISHEILPKSLDEGALISSLQSQLTSLNLGLKHEKIELFCYDFPAKIDEEWIYDLYLISLEIINNALKHGNSTLINIELYKYSSYYHFQFTDDGIGFNQQNTKMGFGLDNIKKRVLYYKGTFEINSNESQGTIIQISIPVK